MDDRQTPERPAPSLLQDVLCHAVGRLTDRARYFPGTIPNSSPFEVRGTPTGTCDFGQGRYRDTWLHNQLKSWPGLKKCDRRTMLPVSYPGLEQGPPRAAASTPSSTCRKSLF